MKLTKRIITLMLALVMVLSALSGLTALAYQKNIGTRHEVCTELSSQAKSFYTGQYTYETLSQLEGTSTGSCLKAVDTPMYKQLHEATKKGFKSGAVTYKGSNGLQEFWPDTDRTADTSKPILFYSDAPSNNFNREHVWPKSRASFYENGGGCDLHHLRPANEGVNSSRKNYTMGNTRQLLQPGQYSTDEYDGKTVIYYNASYYKNGCNGIVEVNDNIKGDVARILLYVYVRWEEPNLFENDPSPKQGNNDNGGNNGFKVIADLDTLLEWCEIDPVDTWEMSRNDACQTIQGGRNIFIDYPEFAWLLFNQELPEMVTPSGKAMSAPRFSVTATSENEAYGTVSIKNKTITASPAEGYRASGYTVTPAGAATVSQNGNIFTVSNVTEDCNVTIKFAAKDAATITYIVPNGITVNGTTSSYVGDTIKTASVSGVPDGYTFFGWSKKFIEDTAVQPSGWGANYSYTITDAETTFYSVFWYKTDSGSYRYRSDFPVECSHEATHVETVDPTCTEKGATNTVCDACGNVLKTEEIAALGHDYTSEITKPATPTEDGILTYTCSRCADSYTEVIPATGEECKHESTYEDIEEPTCTEAGTRTTLCNTCGAVIHTEEIAALGHDYTTEITKPATEKEYGILTYTCSRCADSYTELIPATGVHVCPSEDYTDIDTSRWYHEPIDYVLSHGLMNGMGNGIFAPDGSVTRAMLVTILYRADGQTSVEGMTHSFTDVPENVYYTNAVIWAAENGIVNGVTETQFAPNANITREQIATILYRYAKAEPVDLPLDNYPDADLISNYAQDAIRWAVGNGIINGKDGMLAPIATATRAEIAAMLSRYLSK